MPTDIEVSVTLLYGGSKAQQFLEAPTDFRIQMLHKDLLTLKLPHPKRENIKFISGFGESQGFSFFWPRVPREGALHKNIQHRVKPYGSMTPEAHSNMLDDLSIISLFCKERPVIQHPIPPYKPPRTRSMTKHQIGTENPHNQSSPQLNPRHMHIDRVQMLLNDIAESLIPNKIPKIEPVDPPSLFDEDSNSIASSRPSVTTRSPLLPPITILDTNHSDCSSSVPISPHESLLARVGPPVTVPPPSVMSPELVLPGISRKRVFSPDPDTDMQPSKRPPPQPRDLLKIQTRTRELWDLRREITASIARETSILNELKSLDSPFIPGPSARVITAEDSDDKARLRMIEKELQAEKKRREEAEAILGDVRRECREPFVVPALLDAFVLVSKITTQAMDMDP